MSDPSVITVPLTQEQVALVDREDWEQICGFGWYASKQPRTYYAVRPKVQCKDGESTLMHRLIMQPLPGQFIDHINGNGLDNRRSNLRFATMSQNIANSQPNEGRKFKGVYWHSRDKAWVARIKCQGAAYNLGYFAVEADAARAYDEKALELYGEFARINFPRQEYVLPAHLLYQAE